MRRFNQRHALRFPTEVHRSKPVLVEQRIIRALVWIIVLLFAWPLIVADKYTDSRRYREAEYIELVDGGIWMGAFVLLLAWVLLVFAIFFTLSSGG